MVFREKVLNVIFSKLKNILFFYINNIKKIIFGFLHTYLNRVPECIIKRVPQNSKKS